MPSKKTYSLETPPEKKLTVKTPFFLSKKILLGGMVVVLFLFFFQKQGFLSAVMDTPQRDESAVMYQMQREEGSVPIGDAQEDIQADDSARDVYIGPVRLSRSSYIRDQLDAFSQEQSTASSQKISPLSSPGDIFSHYSLSDFIAHPLTSIAGVTSSMKNSWENDGKRTTVIKLVDSLSRYYISFRTFPDDDGSLDNYRWVDEMVDKREMSGVYEYVLKKTSPVAYCGTLSQTGYCYKTDGKNAVVYVRLAKVGDSFICGEENGIFFLWSSGDNKLGAVCLSGEPTQLQGFEYIQE